MTSRWPSCLLVATVLASACSLHSSRPPAFAAGSVAAPPFGPGLADTDREFEAQEVVPVSPNDAMAPSAPNTTTNVKLTQLGGLGEAETTIAVNPTNPLNIVAGAISVPGCYFYTSLDGGLTWTQGALPIPAGYTNLGDPTVTFCGDGSAYYQVLAFNPQVQTAVKSNIFIYRSTDGGLTWPTSSQIGERRSVFQDITDKGWMTCDTSGSAHDGTIYLEYSNPQNASCSVEFCRAIKLRRSTDHGATWAPEVIVSDFPQSPQNQGSVAVGPNGEVYVAWDLTDGIKFDKSTDGGVTFGTDLFVVGIAGIPPDPNFRRTTYPIIDADRTNGPHRGSIYFAYSDLAFGDPDILVVRSTDGGATWIGPVRVNDDTLFNHADQWAPGLTVDPLGRVIVTFYDRRRYIGKEKYEIWGAISRDGGITFDTNFLIGDTPSDVPVPNTFLGDYDCVAADSNYLYATWADQRNQLTDTAPDIYSDRYRNNFAYDEVKNVFWFTQTIMYFDVQDARFGIDLDYDIAGGSLSELRADHGWARAGCVAPLWSAPPFVDARIPPPGDGYYYLVRAHKNSGVGTYGDGWPPKRPNVRDELDETPITCP
jgi:hypothetical protein